MTRIEERGRARLKLRFPDCRARFDLGSGEFFLDLCEAYELANVALEHWIRSDAPKSGAMITEYREIIASLEAEAKVFATQEPEFQR
ncbi:hypothetical protein [Bosea sp. NBC_00550]|uniref:hypothetical protein n=1 Tax=Bosea sp. NBC_00550 TaxID=2969621 RepID=UPI00222E4D16|nr:hypothetical protein [Bosea sp. NBC_00550]UZF93782.1 hypothetical protein NWE53_06200 [Bosea sp. NBC_00550]